MNFTLPIDKCLSYTGRTEQLRTGESKGEPTQTPVRALATSVTTATTRFVQESPASDRALLDRKLEEKNKNIVRQTHEEVWNKGNMTLVDELYTSDYVGHWAAGADTHGRNELKQRIITSRANMPDLTENIEQIIAEGNLVVTHFRASGTFTGIVEEISFKNTRVAIQEIAIYRIFKGKIAEQWTIANNLLLMQQLGFKPMHPSRL